MAKSTGCSEFLTLSQHTVGKMEPMSSTTGLDARRLAPAMPRLAAASSGAVLFGLDVLAVALSLPLLIAATRAGEFLPAGPPGLLYSAARLPLLYPLGLFP